MCHLYFFIPFMPFILKEFCTFTPELIPTSRRRNRD